MLVAALLNRSGGSADVSHFVCLFSEAKRCRLDLSPGAMQFVGSYKVS